jgi:hypothetical protein
MNNEESIKSYLEGQLSLLKSKIEYITGTSWNGNVNIPQDVNELTVGLRDSIERADVLIGKIQLQMTEVTDAEKVR